MWLQSPLEDIQFAIKEEFNIASKLNEEDDESQDSTLKCQYHYPAWNENTAKPHAKETVSSNFQENPNGY